MTVLDLTRAEFVPGDPARLLLGPPDEQPARVHAPLPPKEPRKPKRLRRPRRKQARVVGGFTTEQIIRDVEQRLAILDQEAKVLRKVLRALDGGTR